MAEQILPTPQTRVEMYQSFLSGDTTYTPETLPKPITRKEMYLAFLCGVPDVQVTEPLTREEIYLKFINDNGGIGGGSIVKTGEYIPPVVTVVTYEPKNSPMPTVLSGEYVPPTTP